MPLLDGAFEAVDPHAIVESSCHCPEIEQAILLRIVLVKYTLTKPASDSSFGDLSVLVELVAGEGNEEASAWRAVHLRQLFKVFLLEPQIHGGQICKKRKFSLPAHL